MSPGWLERAGTSVSVSPRLLAFGGGRIFPALDGAEAEEGAGRGAGFKTSFSLADGFAGGTGAFAFFSGSGLETGAFAGLAFAGALFFATLGGAFFSGFRALAGFCTFEGFAAFLALAGFAFFAAATFFTAAFARAGLARAAGLADPRFGDEPLRRPALLLAFNVRFPAM